MKNLKKLLCILLAGVLALSLAACKPKPPEIDETTTGTPETPVGKFADIVNDIAAAADYQAKSKAVYDAELGEFYTLYQKGSDCQDLGLRYAIMAQAEAKLLEAAVFLPGTTRGGNYGISRVAKRSGSTQLWGVDADRLHSLIVVKDLIKAEDNNHLSAKWKELKGTGTYADYALKYLKDKGYELKNEYRVGYSSDPTTWDAGNTSRQPDTECIIPMLDFLVRYDEENTLKPCLAETWEKSEDGLTWTFHLRDGVKWVDQQGREVADLKADDFVAGMQHMIDTQSGLGDLISGKIVNADKYISGEITDFAQVGVKALDEKTVQYTLVAPLPYFESMLTYNPFAPLCRSYYESKGGKFGIEEYEAVKATDAYTFGKTPENTPSCGAYLVKNFTKENTIVYELNPTYWDKDNVRIHKITKLYNDGKDVTKAYYDTVNDKLDGCGLNSASVEAAKKDGKFEAYATISDTDATSFVAFLNLARSAYHNFDAENKCVSTMTEEQKKATDVAVLNPHFRRAIGMGINMEAYNAQVTGDELALVSVRNSYTPGNFVQLPTEVKIDVNGTEKTYAAGTYYGQIMQDQITADGIKLKVWDDKNLVSDGFAGWYNPANAMEELNLAIAELKEAGVEVSKEKPIVLDLPAFTSNQTYKNRAEAFKKAIEDSLQGNVVVNCVDCPTSDDWYNCGFYTEKGDQANYSLYDVSGWGPDFGDPSTYLDTMLPDGAGYMAKCLGIY